MNIKEWFEKGTNFKIKESRYIKPPQLPYFLFSNKKIYKGADLINNILENNIVIERYSESNNSKDLIDIEKVNYLLTDSGYEYDIQTDWIEEEQIFGTFWVLEPILEKNRKE